MRAIKGSAFQEAFKQWKKRWERCIASRGVYFERHSAYRAVKWAIKSLKQKFGCSNTPFSHHLMDTQRLYLAIAVGAWKTRYGPYVIWWCGSRPIHWTLIYLVLHLYTGWSQTLYAPDEYNMPYCLTQSDCLAADRQDQGGHYSH
jgi:hypothetical protein